MTKKRRSQGKDVHPLEAKVGRLYADFPPPSSDADLPQAEAPPLSELRVTLPPPPPVTPEELMVRLQELLREKAARTARPAGAEVQLGDEVLLDLVGYVDEALLPGSIRVGAWMELAPLPHLPGLAETVAGTKVGEGCALELELPQDYPVTALQGKLARFLVEVHAACEVEALDAEDPAALHKLDLGATLDEVMDAVRALVDDEREAEQALRLQEAVLDKLAELTRVELSPALIEEELRRGWATREAPLLQQKGFDAEEQAEALAAWLSSAELRSEAEHRLRVTLGLEAVARRDGLDLTPEALRETVGEVSAQTGLEPKHAAKVLDQDPALGDQVARTARHLMLVSHVVSAAQVEATGG